MITKIYNTAPFLNALFIPSFVSLLYVDLPSPHPAPPWNPLLEAGFQSLPSNVRWVEGYKQVHLLNRKSKNTVFGLFLCKNNFSESLVKRNILQNISNSIILDPNLNLWKLKSYLTAFCLFFGFLQLYCHLYFLGNIWTEKKIQAPPQLGHTGPNHKH